jgi:hypothetical protein
MFVNAGGGGLQRFALKTGICIEICRNLHEKGGFLPKFTWKAGKLNIVIFEF